MARKKRHAQHEEEASEAWLLPYSDLMTLLLATFIALYAMSATDSTKMAQMAQAFSAAFNTGGPSFFDQLGPSVSRHSERITTEDKGNSAYIQETKSLEEVQKELDEYISQNNLQGELNTTMTDDGLMIRIKEKALFPSGSAELVEDAQKIGPVVAGLLAKIPERVVISGHTDNMPIATARYPSNWELSSQRALNFMKFLFASNTSLNPARFSSVGYSEYRPIADNQTDEGRSQNRRVEVLISRTYQFNPDSSAVDPLTAIPELPGPPVNLTSGIKPVLTPTLPTAPGNIPQAQAPVPARQGQ